MRVRHKCLCCSPPHSLPNHRDMDIHLQRVKRAHSHLACVLVTLDEHVVLLKPFCDYMQFQCQICIFFEVEEETCYIQC